MVEVKGGDSALEATRLLETALTAVERLKGLSHIEKSQGEPGIVTECFERFALGLANNGTWAELADILNSTGWSGSVQT